MRRYLGAALMAFVVSLSFVPAASAAIEVGSDCTANASERGLVVSEFETGDSPVLLATPEAGVVTGWRIRVEEGRPALSERLLVLRSVGKGLGQMVTRESEPELAIGGTNEFATRLPVRSGDRFGLSGLTETFFCETGVGLSRVFEGTVPVGEVRPFGLREGIGAPIVALVEPDRDGDGYGDETQDMCPQSADFHLQACSPARLAVDAEAHLHSILVRVRADMRVSAQVFGQVGWGFKPSPKLKTAGDKPTRLIVGLNGPKKTVLPGERVPFRVPLPKSVLRRLGRLSPRESLTAKLTVSCTDLDGRIKQRRLDVKLRDRAPGGNREARSDPTPLLPSAGRQFACASRPSTHEESAPFS